MGAAVSSMHYTGMLAVTVQVTPSGGALHGATAMQFIFPLAVGLGSYLFLTSAFVALSPTAPERAAYVHAEGAQAPADGAVTVGRGPDLRSRRAARSSDTPPVGTGSPAGIR